jgi:hypothetical protein
MAAPDADAGQVRVTLSQQHLDDINVDQLIPCHACCCFIQSLYTDTTNCWGCNTGGQICCVDTDVIGFKRSKEEGKYCILCEGSVSIIKPKTCMQFTSQFFILDCRGALPATDEVPCTVNLLGLNLFYRKKFIPGCCKNIGALKEVYAAKEKAAGGGAAPVLEMSR